MFTPDQFVCVLNNNRRMGRIPTGGISKCPLLDGHHLRWQRVTHLVEMLSALINKRRDEASRMDKVVATTLEAVADVPDGASLAVGGFGLSGVPDVLIQALY